MNIQIINFSREGKEGEYTYSLLSAPRSLDEFDANIIDLSSEKIWYSNNVDSKTVNCINDFKSIGTMVNNSKSSSIIFVLPQDGLYHFSPSSHYENNKERIRYQTKRIKDILLDFQNILSVIIPAPLIRQIIYEKTVSRYGSSEYEAAFFFSSGHDAVILSCGSKKTTMVHFDNRLYLTSLNILADKEKTDNFIAELFGVGTKQEKPEWMEQIRFGDDEEQKAVIAKNEDIIHRASEDIKVAEKKLEENDRYKSILYTNGDELVEVVFSILEKLLDCDLSQFVDEKNEDFQIKKDGYTLIGEIKGVTSNVRSEHISQVDVHYQGYMDKLVEEGRTENVHQVLIMNPLRTRPLDERDPVYDAQIRLAERNGCLIVETATLLKLFEKFLAGEVDTAFCEKLFTEKTGLLQESDF